MTVEEIKASVAAIRDMASDDEAAHAHEDQLHQTVLQAIADGTCPDPQACAAEALKTNEIRFERWCA